MDLRFQCYHRDGAVFWRLLGSNNRALARSAGGFDDVATCVADATEVAALAAGSTIDMVSEAGTAWRWLLVHEGVPRVMSGGPYARRLECVRAVSRFRAWAATARIDRVCLVSDVGGRRRSTSWVPGQAGVIDLRDAPAPTPAPRQARGEGRAEPRAAGRPGAMSGATVGRAPFTSGGRGGHPGLAD